MIWFTSDNHFGHFNIIEYCGRPFRTLDGMNEAMIYRWNSIVKDEDTVYHLGDLVFNKHFDIAGKLKGKIILIKGNHDKYTTKKFNEMGMLEIHKTPLEIELQGKKFYLVHSCFEKPAKGYAINLCGHVHNIWKHNYGYINVGVDVRGFNPVSIDEIIEEHRKMKEDNKWS